MACSMFAGSNDDDLSETVLKMCDLILERSSPEEKSQAEFDEIHPEVNSSNCKLNSCAVVENKKKILIM